MEKSKWNNSNEIIEVIIIESHFIFYDFKFQKIIWEKEKFEKTFLRI